MELILKLLHGMAKIKVKDMVIVVFMKGRVNVMSETLYRLINDDNERHLVPSRENPDRFRGQTRDKDNKNPRFNELEPVVVPDYEYELEKLAHDEKMAEIQARQSAADIVTSIFNLIDTVVTFVGEYPEVVVATVQAGKKAKQGIVNVKNKLASVVSDGKKKAKEPVKKIAHKPKTSDIQIAEKARNEVIEEVSETSQVERENMSVEEADELILEILLDYISMKKKLNRLSNANIKHIERQELNVDDVIAQLDSLIKEYPALMDESTIENISALLKMNAGLQENTKIKEILNLNFAKKLH